MAGFETTTNLITNAVYRLLEHHEQRRTFMADPTLDRTCMEESLRFDPPAQFMRARTTVADTRIGGTDLHPGDPVIPLFAAANRDPDEFKEPELFDVTRKVNLHLSFGVGHIFASVRPLARMEGGVAVRRLFERFPHMSISKGPSARVRPGLQLRGFSKLSVDLFEQPCHAPR